MKKKTLTERLNRYFSAEESKINIPPIETIRAYKEFPAGSETREPAATPPVRKSVRHLRRVVMIAACLAVVIAVAVGISASIGEPESTVGGTPESNEGGTNEQPATSLHPAVSDAQDEPLEGITSEDESPIEEVSGSEIHEGPATGNGMGGDGEAFERYYPDELFDLYLLSHLVTWDDIYAAENKLLTENEYFYNEQLPPLYLFIRELNIRKEDFVRFRDENEPACYTDEQIEWLFSDADIQTIQKELKLDTALLCNGRLYNPYELLRLEPSQLREMAGTEEMNAYFDDLIACLRELDRKAAAYAEENPYVGDNNNSFLRERQHLSGLMDKLKDKLEEAGA